jgi:hypothetical protein
MMRLAMELSDEDVIALSAIQKKHVHYERNALAMAGLELASVQV